MVSANYTLIRDAIANKKQVLATYDGHHRELCPHVIGLNKDGEEQALLYQFSGSSKSGLEPAGSPRNWRCVALSRLSNVSTRDGPWYSVSVHTKPQTCVKQVDLEVAY